MAPTPYAGLVTRALALLVDAIVINVIAAITGAALGLIGSLLGVGNLGIVAAVTGGLLWLAWTGLYFIAFWSVTGQTPGARLLGIRVIPGDGRRVGIIASCLRFAVMIVALVPLGAGFITVLFDDRRRGPHDIVAGTVVRWASVKAVEPEVAAVLAAEAMGDHAPPTAPHPSAAAAPPPAVAPRPADPPTLPAEEPPPSPLGGLPRA